MPEITAADGLNLAIGAAEIVLALLLLRHLARFARAFPWLVALMLFFVLRGVDRIYAAGGGDESLALLLDAVLLTVLVLLLFGLEGTIGGLRAARDEAAFREAEYERALSEYRQLARHRLANPIATIRGAILTLRAQPDLDETTKTQLLHAVESEAERLERVALDPVPQSEEERVLDPEPQSHA